MSIPEKRRCFIAANPDPDCLAFLTAQLTRLREAKCETPIRWIKPENLHLTLKFLGDTTAQQSLGISAILESMAQNSKEIRVCIHEARYFPRASQARVVACGMDKNEQLSVLAASIDSECEILGFTREQRPFRGHISIGRIKTRKLKPLPVYEPAECTWTIKRLSLMQSILSAEGARYQELAGFSLQSSGN